MDFRNKIVVVTGAASGIGAATARSFLADGATVVLADHDQDALREIEYDLSRDFDSRYHCITTNVSDVDSVHTLSEFTIEQVGAVDIVVSNAGIWGKCDFLSLPIDEWDRINNVNLRGQFIVCQTFARQMAGHGTRGSIILTASTNSFIPEENVAHYNASKGGVLQLAKSMGGRPSQTRDTSKRYCSGNNTNSDQRQGPQLAGWANRRVRFPACPTVG